MDGWGEGNLGDGGLCRPEGPMQDAKAPLLSLTSAKGQVNATGPQTSIRQQGGRYPCMVSASA